MFTMNTCNNNNRVPIDGKKVAEYGVFLKQTDCWCMFHDEDPYITG